MSGKPKKPRKMDPADYNWSKFKWRDWQGDPALRMCSPAARGVWMDMLSIMFEATPRGHLLVNGRQPNMTQLGSVFGVSERIAKTLVDELDAAGVFSRTDGGVIFNRRMVRDKAASDAGREFGSRGGNPALSAKDNAKPDADTDDGNGGGLTPKDNGNGYAQPLSDGLNLERRYPSDERKDPPLAKPPKTEIPNWMPLEAWNGFLAMRKSARKPVTDRAVMLLVGKLSEFRDRGLSVEESLNQSTVAGWTGVFEPRQQKPGQQFRPGPAGALDVFGLSNRDDEETEQRRLHS